MNIYQGKQTKENNNHGTLWRCTYLPLSFSHVAGEEHCPRFLPFVLTVQVSNRGQAAHRVDT
jgi:hypothetical protein